LKKEYQGKHTVSVSADEKTTACRLPNVRNYGHANARRCAHNNQADAMRIRQVSAFTHNENTHSCAGEPADVPELSLSKLSQKQLFMRD